ncbi:hypothetical protein CR513_43387, partial [Mucuna pruriens]
MDREWVGDASDRRSTTHYYVPVGKNLISWKSKKQTVRIMEYLSFLLPQWEELSQVSQFVKSYLKGRGCLSHMWVVGLDKNDPKFDSWDKEDCNNVLIMEFHGTLNL